MLPPDSRAILRDLLRPPPGSQLGHAVGTTFTVDLVSALAVPLSLASRDLGATPDPIGVTEAVRSTAGRIDLFYQAGHAAVPPQASDVLAFLEPLLHPVKAPRAGRLFHPKVWLLKFLNGDDVATYRLVCLTRNLTSDHSWDAVIALDGWAGTRRQAANASLSAFVAALPGMCTAPLPAARAARIAELAREIASAEWELPEDGREVHFHAMGLTRRNTLPDFSGYRRLVVSPFIDAEGLAVVSPPTRDRAVLVSRPEQLDQLAEAPSGVETKVVSVLAELEDERAGGELGGLHAKLVLVERARLTHLFLGSANATHAAFNGNVEFIVELVLGATKHGVDAYLSPDTGLGALLEDYQRQPAPVDPGADLRYLLQDRLRRLAEMPWTLDVRPSASAYDLQLASGQVLPEWSATLTVELLSARGEAVRPPAGEVCDEVFSSVALADITPFLVMTLGEGELTESSVVPAILHGDPVDRLDAVLARQVDTPEKFLRFMLLLLGFGGESAAVGSGGESGSGEWGATASSLFELLAKALAEQPASLDDLGAIVDRLSRTEQGRAVMPEGFSELWSVVQEARESMRSAT